MKQSVVLFLFICISYLSLGQNQERVISNSILNSNDYWQKYKSEDLAFIAYFPEKPKRTVQKVQTDVGELDMHMVMYTSSDLDKDNMVYSIIRSNYPEEEFKNNDSEKENSILNGAVNGAVTNVQGTLLSDKKINLNGYSGRKIKIKINQGYIYLNAFLVENSIFITQVICLPGKEDNKNISRFMESFDILKVK